MAHPPNRSGAADPTGGAGSNREAGQPLLVIAAGGTGGHMFPAQALAEAMLAQGWRVHLATDDRGLRYAGGFPPQVSRVRLRSSTPARGGITARLAVPVAIARGVLGAIWRFRADRPTVVAGFGGYPALPALVAAWVLGVPRLIHEQNGVLGRVNRLFARRVGVVCCGTWPLRGAPTGAALVHTGNPVRARVAELAARAYQPPLDGPIRLVVFGGSQGATVLATLVPRALSMLPVALRTRLSVTQQVRAGEEGPVADTYARAGIAAELAPFFTDLPDRLAAAHLTVARAGASTLAELTVLGCPSVLVPYPAAMDDHQSANAAPLAAAGGANVSPEPGLTAGDLAGQIGWLLGHPDALATMAAAARGVGRPDATTALAAQVALVAGRPA